MKKIISLFAAVAMICTMFTCVAFADGKSIDVVVNEKTDTTLKLDIVLNTDVDIASCSIKYFATNLITAGASVVSVESITADQALYATTSGQITLNCTTAREAGSIALGTITLDISKMTQDASLIQKTASNTNIRDAEKNAIGTSFANNVLSYSVEAPKAAEEKFEAKVNGDEITFENAALSDKNKEIGGKAIKLFGKNFTVKADSTSKFVITYDNKETKTFGKTAAEYLGIEGKGDATGNVTVGIIYDKEQYSADDFSIAQE